jgi:hypothetical protein
MKGGGGERERGEKGLLGVASQSKHRVEQTEKRCCVQRGQEETHPVVGGNPGKIQI